MKCEACQGRGLRTQKGKPLYDHNGRFVHNGPPIYDVCPECRGSGQASVSKERPCQT